MSTINPLLPSGSLVAAPFSRGAAPAAADFAGLLTTAQELDADAQRAEQERVRTAASQLVATALIQPVLAELRDSPFKSERFHGGRGEEVFGQQLDTLLADRIASSPGFGASAAVAQQLSGQTGLAATGTAVNTRG